MSVFVRCLRYIGGVINFMCSAEAAIVSSRLVIRAVPSLLAQNKCPVYLALDRDDILRRETFRALFDTALSQSEINLVRASINRGLVLEDDRFKLEIEAALKRRIEPGKHGGDRKSERFLEGF